MANRNTIEIGLIIRDDGSVVIKQFAGKSLKAFGQVEKGGKQMGDSLKSLKRIAITALTGWGIKALSSSFLDAAKTTENYRTRLNILLGDVKEGGRLFDAMATYASKTPFEYEKIMQSATALSGVMKGGVEEIKAWMPLIGDLAATSGLSIEQTTEQVIRMYSAGAASADLFRERGILAMLGFEAGATYSVEETRKKMVESWNKADSQFRGATGALAENWEGIMSMFSDKWFSFRNMVMENDAFGSLKSSAQSLLKTIEQMEREGTLEAWASAIGKALSTTTNLVRDAIEYWTEFFSMSKKAELSKLKQEFEDLTAIMAGDRKWFQFGSLDLVADRYTKVFNRIQQLEEELTNKSATESNKRRDNEASNLKTTVDATKAAKKELYGFETKEELDYFKWKMKNDKDAHKQWVAIMDAEVAITDDAYKDRTKAVQDTARTIEKIQDDLASSTLGNYEYEKLALDKRYDEYSVHIKDKALLDAWYADQQSQLWLQSEDVLAQITRSLQSEWTSATNKMVDDFVAGENMKQSVAEMTKNTLVNTAASAAKEAYSKAIGHIVGMIGAYIGQGAAGVSAWAAPKGGVWGVLKEIGLYLATAVGSMYAGRAMASQFKATGGWIEEHPNGGWIQEGSGVRDDVFLGATPGVRHWGMGGEYVIRKEAAQRWGPLLEALNRSYESGGLIYSGQGDKYITWQGERINWTDTADSLAIGAAMSFAHGIPKGLIGAIIELATYFATAVPSMFGGKLLANQFRATGGWIDVGHGFGSFVKKISKPWKAFKEPKDLLTPWQGLGEIITSFPGTPRGIKYMQDPEQFYYDVILDMIRAPLEQISKDLVTPRKYYSNPLDELSTNITNLKNFAQSSWKMALPEFHQGIDYVPATGAYRLQQGERVVDRDTNLSGGSAQPIVVSGPLVHIENFSGSEAEITDLTQTLQRKLRKLGEIKFGVAGIDI